MLVVNIVDRIDMVNFGIWNAATATAPILNAKYGVISQLWFPRTTDPIPQDLPGMIDLFPIDNPDDLPSLPSDTIVVTHGCWRLPTRLGYRLKKKGYPWMFVPHGMLEPWSMSQKWYLKFPYYWLFEKPQSTHADVVRAVSLPEKLNLQRIYSHVIHIPNGNFPPKNILAKNWTSSPLNFLFLARLHKKKGLIPLLRSWKRSSLNNNPAFRLIIAGPDDGLLGWLKNQLPGTSNVSYIGPVFGEEKNQLLQQAHFFVLPSFSEGFPTSVVEAMQYGLIPIISEGCNFPEAFEQELAIKVLPEETHIKEILEHLTTNLNDLDHRSEKCRSFAQQYYSLEHIADLQYHYYQQLVHH